MTDAQPWLEDPDEYEGVGADPRNRRYDHDTALLDARLNPVRRNRVHARPQATPTPGRPTGFPTIRGLLTTSTALAVPRPAALVHRLDGHDGSHYQWDAGPVRMDVLEAWCWWLAWKATQSTRYIDPTFTRTRELAHRRFRQFFAYHWLSSITDPEAQAAHTLRAVGPLDDGEGFMLDAEEAGITVEWCLGWLEAVERRTHRPASVYSGLYVAGGSIWRSAAIRESRYGPRPMHLAAYIDPAKLWARMQSLGVAHLPVHLWQYSSNGPVPGISGRADMNTVLDEATVYRSCYPAVRPMPTPRPTPIPDPTPTPTDPTEDDEMSLPILTNAEAFPGGDNPVDPMERKYVLNDDGSKRHISYTEWVARGAKPGTPLTWEQLGEFPGAT